MARKLILKENRVVKVPPITVYLEAVSDGVYLKVDRASDAPVGEYSSNWIMKLHNDGRITRASGVSTRFGFNMGPGDMVKVD